MKLHAFLVTSLALCGGVQAGTTEKADLSGQWKLNPEESEDAREKVRAALKGTRSGGWGPGPGGFGGPMGPMGRPQGGYGRRATDPRELARSILQAPPELLVTQSDEEIAVEEKGGRRRTLHPDGRKYKMDGGRVHIRTRWSADRLVVESRPESGGKITETLGLSAEGRKMTVTVRLETPMIRDVEVRRVYDRMEETDPTQRP